MKRDCPPESELAALVSGTLGPTEVEPLVEHVGDCEACSERIEKLARAAAIDVRGLAIRERTASRSPASTTPSWPMFAGLAAGILIAVLLLVRANREPRVIEAPGPPGTGSIAVRAFARTATGIDELTREARVGKEDRVRLAVAAYRSGFLFVVSVGSNGGVRAIHPAKGSGSRAIRAGQREFLPGTLRIDDADLPRRIFALFSATPISLQAVRSALKAGQWSTRLLRIPLPNVEQWTLLLVRRAGDARNTKPGK